MTIVYKANRIEGLSSDTKPADQYNGRIFYETDTSKSFSFDGSIWNEIGGGTVSSSISYAYSQNIADYTTPTTVTSSSDGSSTATYPTSASGSGGYNGYANIANSYDGNDATDVNNAIIYRTDIPAWLTSTATWDWGSSQTGNLRILYKEYRATEANSSFQYSDNGSSWTTLLNTNTGANNVNVDYLSSSITWRYVRVNRSITSGTYNNNYTLSVYEISKYAPSTPNLYDDNTTTISKTTAEANPSFTADMGSSTECSHYAIYMEADSDETQYVIQYSNDDVTYTTLRTINSTDLTNGAWNYIRFNPVNARYIRIRGNSGNTKTLSATQIKVLNGITDTVASHEHLEIDTADTSLTLGGSTA